MAKNDLSEAHRSWSLLAIAAVLAGCGAAEPERRFTLESCGDADVPDLYGNAGKLAVPAFDECSAIIEMDAYDDEPGLWAWWKNDANDVITIRAYGTEVFEGGGGIQGERFALMKGAVELTATIDGDSYTGEGALLLDVDVSHPSDGVSEASVRASVREHGTGGFMNLVRMAGSADTLSFDGVSLSMKGSSEPPASTGTPGGGTGTPGGGSCASAPRCEQLKQACANSIGQAMCYCAAACYCHACGDTACETANRKNAMMYSSTGEPNCSY